MKPQDLFLGIRDFLSLLVPGIAFLVLFPGSVLTWLSKPIRIGTALPDTTLLVLVFLAAALTAGSILSGLAGLLDERVDRNVSRWMEEPTRGHVLKAKAFARQLAKLAATERLAGRLADEINPLSRDFEQSLLWTPRAFWWNYLRLNCPIAIAELDRIEGLQKQFRSLVVVAFAAALFAIESPIEWSRLAGSLAEVAGWKAAFAPLLNWKPWALASVAFLVMAFCFSAYVGYRIRFARRLFELAVIQALPKERVDTGTRQFFSAEVPPSGL